MAVARVQFPALLVSSVLCVAVGVGGGMLAMRALGYHREPQPTDLADGGSGQPWKSPG
jgi:hypothetical protein